MPAHCLFQRRKMVTKQSKPTDANYDDDDNNYDIFYSENPVVIKAPTIVNNNCYDGESAHRDITRFSARIIHFYRKRKCAGTIGTVLVPSAGHFHAKI